MDAALEVFAEKGLKNATMDDVAEKAELSKGTIYLYFKSKEHLFFAIDMRAGQILRERFAEAARSVKTGVEKVRAIGRAYYRFCFDYPNFFKAMSYVESMDVDTFKAIAAEMLPKGEQGGKQSSLAILADAIEMGHKDGSISKDMHPWLTAILLWSTSNGVIQMIKNRGEYLKLFDLDIADLYPAKEKLVGRGLAPENRNQKDKTP
jgi:AcrR family transcriptional regulator